MTERRLRVSGGIVHYGLHLVFDILCNRSEGQRIGKHSKKFGGQCRRNFGASAFVINRNAAWQCYVYADVLGENLGRLCWIANFEDVAGMSQRESLGSEGFLEVIGVEHTESVFGHGCTQIFNGGTGCFGGFNCVTHIF